MGRESAVMLDVLGTGAGSFSLWWSDNIDYHAATLLF